MLFHASGSTFEDKPVIPVVCVGDADDMRYQIRNLIIQMKYVKADPINAERYQCIGYADDAKPHELKYQCGGLAIKERFHFSSHKFFTT